MRTISGNLHKNSVNLQKLFEKIVGKFLKTDLLNSSEDAQKILEKYSKVLEMFRNSLEMIGKSQYDYESPIKYSKVLKFS